MNKIIVLSQGRTGSTYICNLLKHNFDQCIINPFEENIENILEIIESNLSILIKDNQIIKLLNYEIPLYKKYIDIINKNFYRIKVIRNDIFHLTLSRIIAEKNNVFYYDSDYCLELENIDVKLFKDYLNKTYLHFKNLQKYEEYDSVIYHENLTGDAQIDFKSLNLNLLPPQSLPFIKLNYTNVIRNYSELYSIYMDLKNVQL